MSYGSEITIDRVAQDRYLAIVAPTVGHLEIRHRGERHVISAGRSLGVLSPESQCI